MQVDRKNIEVAERGMVVGLKTVERVREGDKVYVMQEVDVEELLKKGDGAKVG
jgi:putative protease